ncbi:AAA family ATPase [Campylobacterota bacterium]
MPLKTKFKVTETLHENSRTTVYRAIRLADKRSVILKLLKSSARDSDNISQFVNEQKALTSVRSQYIVRLLDVISTPSEYIHVLEDIGGSSLYDILLHQKLNLEDALALTLDLLKALESVHKSNIIHADINPKNIIYNPHTRDVQLIDFGYSLQYEYLDLDHNSKTISSGNLLYMSPEQTGLTQEAMDLRSDLYSLGMSLYHLFLGHIPFEAKDRYELTHKQVAFNPVPLHTLDKNIPLVISKIVEKLIHKNPQERYQSDEAIIYDIKKAIKRLDHSGKISDFKIATRNRPHLHIGTKLFGRNDEIRLLKEASKNLNKKSLIGIISGNSGVGKTRLVEEFLSYTHSLSPLILRGKFDQHHTRLPYLCFKQVFTQLNTLLLSQQDYQDLSSISAHSVSILSFIFPELKPILPSKSTTYSSFSQDMNTQLPKALDELFTSIATQERPLIIFMDDLQWADPATLELLEKSIIDTDNPYLNFIGAYRDNEIVNNKNAQKLVNLIIKDKPESVFEIKLLPLTKSDLEDMLTTLLSSKSKKVKELSSIIHLKTDGNPFYIKTLLSALIAAEELYFENGKWDYSIEKVQSYSASTNIAQLINSKFLKLAPTKQKYLGYLSILGSSFDLELTLKMMNAFGFDNEIIQEIQNDGFIYISMHQYQFAHDQIQEKIYKSLLPNEKHYFHLKIGKYLQHAYERKEYTDSVIIVEHLNNAYEKDKLPKYLFKLNIIALEDILSNNLYPLALEKLKWIQKHLFKSSLWENERTSAFKFMALSIKTLYLNTLHEEATTEVEKLIKKTKTIDERLLCFSLYKNICVTQGRNFNSLVKFGNELFEELGLKTPNDNDDLSDSVKVLQNKISKHSLFNNPTRVLHQPQHYKGKDKSISTLLMDFWEAAFYLADMQLMQWSYLNIVYSSFEDGNTSASSFGYVLYGAQLVSQREYKKAYTFGQVALKLNHSFGDVTMLPKINNFVANFINPFSKPLLSNVSIYQESLHQSKLNGDIVFGTWANFLMHFSHYLSGAPLDEVKDKITHESDFIRNSGDLKMIAIHDILVRTIDSMQGFDTISMFDEESALEIWEKDDFYPALAWYAIIQAQDCFLKGLFDEGLSYLEKYVNTTSNEVIMFPKLRLHFMRALLLLNKKDALNDKEMQTLKMDLEEFGTYAKAAPANFKFGKLLLQAEQMKHTSSAWDVVKIYDKSLQEARKLKNPFFLAISALCASHFWKDLNYNDLSNFYFNEAIVGLNQWGAFSLVKYLKSNIRIEEVSKPSKNEHNSSSSSSAVIHSNFQSLLSAFSNISKSTNTQELTHTLMQIILQNATASKAILLLEDDRRYLVRASIDFQTQEIKDYHLSIDESDFIPKNIINYTINTGETVNIQRPSENGKFQFDTYVQNEQPASCLCIPTFLEGSLKGLLYLENREVHTPLNDDTIKTLELLLSQAVIVYQNTSLYETMKINEEKLNKAQEISHVGSWQFNTQDEKIKWSAETYRIYELEPFSLDIDGEWFFSHVHPDDLEYVSNAAKKAVEHHGPYDVIHRIVIPNGKEKIVHQKAEILMDGDVQLLSGTIQDITQSERARKAISSLSQVVDQNPFSTLITDTDGFIIHINAKALQMTGYTHEELIHKKMNIFRSDVHSEEFYTDLWRTIKDAKSVWRGTLVNKMKNGDLLDCESTIFPLFDDKNNIINFVTIQEDATQRNIKDKLFLMQSRQAQMGEMLSMIAHQWRQPLSIMTALMNKQRVDILLDKANLDDIVHSYDNLETQIKHLSNTINDFRDFFKPDKKPVQTKSSTIVSKAYTLVEHIFKQSKIKVAFNYHSDKSYTTFEREMEQVLLNLFKNAQDAFIERNVESPHLHITCDHEDEYAIIHIEDNAQGINPDVIETIFLPYVSTKDQKQGTGLGLYMSKTIVEEHCKGSLDVQNTEAGAKFTIRIPLEGHA